jgi:hypothetical protein
MSVSFLVNFQLLWAIAWLNPASISQTYVEMVSLIFILILEVLYSFKIHIAPVLQGFRAGLYVMSQCFTVTALNCLHTTFQKQHARLLY